MLTRRGMGGCAICAALGFVATTVQAQTVGTQPLGQPQTLGGVTRTILKRTDLDEKHVVLLVEAEIAPETAVARHTHPGIESGFVLEGGFEQFTVQDHPELGAPKAGEGFLIPAWVPHGGRTAGRRTKLIATYVVEKDKPLASPA
jgi:quercetin dioxygenase-like cupin family protein